MLTKGIKDIKMLVIDNIQNFLYHFFMEQELKQQFTELKARVEKARECL